MHNLAILGSTGSIGTQALAVVSANRDLLSVSALAAYHNIDLLEEQIHQFTPRLAVVVDPVAGAKLKARYSGPTQILIGEDGLLEAASYPPVNIVLTSMVGFAGLRPTLAAIEAGKNIALANKETLVAAGELVTNLAKKKGVKILPVDSEHSAILQSMAGCNPEEVQRLILTASGGPFLGKKPEELQYVSVAECLKHPNWSMGKKITVDSATLANKGLEVIEARWLFGLNYDRSDVVIHPQSIIHSMVEFVDGAIIAQLGMPDMRLPIQYALTYPRRLPTDFPRLNFLQLKELTFLAPDTDTFPALTLAYEAGRIGGTMPCVFNAANEVAVYAFLAGNIGFLDISRIIALVMEKHQPMPTHDLKTLDEADAWARRHAKQLVQAINVH